MKESYNMKKLITKKYLMNLLVAVSVLFSACDKKTENGTQTNQEIIPVKVVNLGKKEVYRKIIASGQFTTDDEAYLSFKTGGVVKNIYVNEGDAVKKGDLLATLDLTEIEAMVQQAKSGYEKALRDYERVSRLYKDSVATLEQYQNAKTGLEIAEKQLKIAEFNQTYSEIRAVESGYILKKFVNAGQIVSPGMPVLQTNGGKSGNWYLKVSVSDNEWATIRINDKAEVELDAYPGKRFEARVHRKSEGIDPYSGTFSVDLKLINSGMSDFASGLYGRAEIQPNEKLSTWVIPFDALLDADGMNGYVFVTNDGTTAERVQVKLGGIDKDAVWITSGLEHASKLIVSGSAYLTDKSAIKIVNQE